MTMASRQCQRGPAAGRLSGGCLGAWRHVLALALPCALVVMLLLAMPLSARALGSPALQGSSPPPASSLQPEPAAGELQLAWLDTQGQLQHTVLDARGQPLRHPHAPLQPAALVPLGSLWKLVAYARLTEATAGPQPASARESDYTCTGHDPEEVYCCSAGQHIDRATALWRSCGLYFEPARLAWAQRPLGDTLAALPPSMQALQQAAQRHPRRTVPLADWLRWLADWAPPTQAAARDDLLAYWLQGPGAEALSAVGSRLRLKTFTLARQTDDRGRPSAAASDTRWAGASGWLDDGRPVWMAARGSSKAMLPHWAPLALRHIDRVDGPVMPPPHAQAPCVQVSFLRRYPIARLRDAQGRDVPSGDAPLPEGDYRAEFAAGHTLALHSQRDLFWQRGPGQGIQPSASADPAQPAPPAPPAHATLTGRFSLEAYVARVIDREGHAEPAAAAQALAVAARSYVLQTGQSEGGCLRIDDSSQAQRVAPRPPTAAARAAAAHTAGLVLRGHIGQYHSSRARPGVLAWGDAVAAAEAGQGFAAILRTAYGPDSLAAAFGPAGTQCEPLPLAQHWLQQQQPRWRRQLQGQAGFMPVQGVQVCRLASGLPHARQGGQRLFVRGFQSLDDRLTLAHEYLHLAFAGHPRATQEAFIEQQAHALLGGP
jgi:uncharacterized protein YfaQ (DUF2300 family)